MLFASPAFTGGLLWQAYLCSQPKLEKGRGPGCCCGAVLWPPLYLWSQPKLGKRRGPGCCCGAVLQRRGGGLAAAAATVLYRRRRCSVARTVSHDNNDYHYTAAETAGYHSRGRRCDRCMVEATAVWRRRYRQIVAGAAAAATVVLRWGGKGWQNGIYAIVLEEAMAAQMPKLTTGVAESVEPPRGSTIREGGDTTISSPGRSSKQPIPWMRLHDPQHGRQACLKFIAFDQGVGQIYPWWGLFSCRSLSKRGQICYIPCPPNR